MGPLWCPEPDSNRHGWLKPRDFKSLASTDFATRARESRGSEVKGRDCTDNAAVWGTLMSIFAHGANPMNLRDSRASYRPSGESR